MFAALNSFLTRAVSGYFLNKSLRFRSSASAYVSRTPAVSGNTNTWTWSGWVKRGTSGFQAIYNTSLTGNSNLVLGSIYLTSADTLSFFQYNLTTPYTTLITTQVFRDFAAWYHIIVAYDDTQATASDRVKIYVNGSQVTSFSTANYPTASFGGYFNRAQPTYFAKDAEGTPGAYFDGEMAEVNFVDGYPTGVTQALWASTNIASSFGASSIYNQWLPIKYAGTYGTNGFYLPFSGGTATSYAGSFNGSSQYLTVPNDAAFTLGATSTTEAWIYVTSTTNNKRIITNGSNTNSFDLGLYNSTNTVFVAGGNANTTTAISLNTWTHVAVVFNSGTLTIYFNGVSQALSGVTTGYSLVASTLSAVFIGAQNAGSYFPGYISNLRVVKGTAVYTANFVPPIAALTAITNTSLLTLQNATIVDNSTNAFTITNNGTVVTSVQSPFLNPTVLVADSSGNGNNWTPNNISLTAGSTYDSLTDVPTLTSTTVANYAVLNPLANGGGTLSNGNLTLTGPSGTWGTRFSTIAVTSGKWYFEVTVQVMSGSWGYMIGITQNPAPSSFLGFDANGYSYYDGGTKYNNNTAAAYGAAMSLNDVIGVAFDATAGTLTFYKNNVSQGVAFSSLAAGTWFLGASCYGSAVAATNFGQQPFVYPTLPTGFLPLNTFNI